MDVCSVWLIICLLISSTVHALGQISSTKAVLNWTTACLGQAGVAMDRAFLRDSQAEYLEIYAKTLKATEKLRNLPVHFYRGYFGPWVENIFIERFMSKPPLYFFPLIPLFIQWTDYSRLVHRMKTDPALIRALNMSIDSRFPYLAVSQHDCGIHQFMKLFPNIIVMSAGGNGHVPIPLLKKVMSMPMDPEKRTIEVLFQGNIRNGPRQELLNKFLRSGAQVLQKAPGKLEDYAAVLAQSAFTFAPFGVGRTSFRMYEALQSGSIPIYIYNDVPWLPYQSRLDWSEFAFVCSQSDVESAGWQVLKAVHNATRLHAMQHAARKWVQSHWTYDGVMQHIDYLFTDTDRSDLYCERPPDQWCIYGLSIFEQENVAYKLADREAIKLNKTRLVQHAELDGRVTFGEAK
uniref:Exostosin GT47 domain-containing protein n=1 Tax=Eutreptiella gymnastica TaxID=73025 RepID=A0A7S4CU00_9EUGL